jgi:hypothetical protein
MPEWLSSRLPEWVQTWHLVVFSIVLAMTMAAVSVAIVGAVLARLPADYFVNPDARRPIDRHPVLKALALVTRNAFGYFLIALGVVLSLPGVPGQGLLTIFMGVMLIDFPGKHRAERWLVSRRIILSGVNRLRAKAGRPPLLVECEGGLRAGEKESAGRGIPPQA